MLTFEEAKIIALEHRSDVNRCCEYKDAFLFSNKKDDMTDGGNEPIVIMKKDGEAIGQLYYYEFICKNYEIIKEHQF